ncbi:hypothetical protein VE01_07662 [Pseudogymnoascus verrucosus]|uniref:Uncharacterized protein n=1 Tax=Pseudogymnoascus verrucosus TaxID=342668 RepID=A0A1B8GHF1_9PEZI|nr:uncharacterized protein VE01_07662 [Pseudogymnoascus verrucosus]OBT95272.2 hypothetical protein VE01_07662 [Pseudogymnoascus verrucosus]
MLILRCAQQARLLPRRLHASSHFRIRDQWEALACAANSSRTRPLTTKPTAKGPSPPLPSKPPSGKPIYPVRLPIYHAGTAPTVVVGFMRISSIISVSAPVPFLLFGHTEVASTFLTAAVAFIISSYVCAPRVVAMYLHLPSYTRYSPELLNRYVASLPKTAEADIKTINAGGIPQTTTLAVGDLAVVDGFRLNAVNFCRVGSAEKRPWWVGKGFWAGRGAWEFAVSEMGPGKGLKMAWVWDAIAEKVRQGKFGGGMTPRVGEVVQTTAVGPKKKL